MTTETPTPRVLKQPARCACGDKMANGCVYCNAFKIGSRIKNSFRWDSSVLYTKPAAA